MKKAKTSSRKSKSPPKSTSRPTPKKNVGVIGLGNMGRGIARNLIKAGHETYVWDTDVTAMEPFMLDATVSPPPEMAARCSLIFFVVPGSTDIEAMTKGRNGILARARRGLVLYDLTTSDPNHSAKLARRAKGKGVAYMDAGMTGGGARGADEGTMTLMIGGEAPVFRRTWAVLSDIAGALYHVGPSGAGHTMKLVNNMVTHTNFMTACEAAYLAGRAGIKLADLIEVINKGNARSYITEHRFPEHILSETWDARSRVYNLHKDVGMAVDMADRLQAQVALGRQTHAYLTEAIKRGMADADFSLIYPDFENIAKAANKNRTHPK
ncbi:MAG: NAD(P)-binding domain-containing protein [Pseudomonadota bacterium]|nr:NAD(P)-binding domain-containing protein [Pseudomonadota bacterium]